MEVILIAFLKLILIAGGLYLIYWMVGKTTLPEPVRMMVMIGLLLLGVCLVFWVITSTGTMPRLS